MTHATTWNDIVKMLIFIRWILFSFHLQHNIMYLLLVDAEIWSEVDAFHIIFFTHSTPGNCKIDQL